MGRGGIVDSGEAGWHAGELSGDSQELPLVKHLAHLDLDAGDSLKWRVAGYGEHPFQCSVTCGKIDGKVDVNSIRAELGGVILVSDNQLRAAHLTVQSMLQTESVLTGALKMIIDNPEKAADLAKLALEHKNAG